MKTVFVAAFCAGAAFAAGPAQAGGYLQIGDVKGSASPRAFDSWVVVHGFSCTNHQGPAGTGYLASMGAESAAEAALAAANGATFSQAKLVWGKNAGMVDMTFKNVTLDAGAGALSLRADSLSWINGAGEKGTGCPVAEAP